MIPVKSWALPKLAPSAAAASDTPWSKRWRGRFGGEVARHRLHATCVSRVLRLALLVPQIVGLDWRQPAGLQLDDLFEDSR